MTGPLLRYAERVRARGAAILAATCVAACLFPSLDELNGSSDATAEAAQDAGPPDSSDATASDVVPAPDGGDGGGCPVSEANLVGYWKLDEGSGLIAHDCSGNGRDGTFVFGTQSNWVAGHKAAGAAILVDPVASSGCVSVPAFPVITGALTLSLWANINSFPLDGGNKEYLLSKAFSFSQGGFRLASSSPPDEYDFGIDKLDSGSFETLASAGAGTWAHVASVYVPGVDVTLYVNGVVVAHKVNAPAAIVDDSKAAFRIGCRGDNDDYVDAIIDEVRVYDRALSASEISALAAQ